MYAIKRKCAPLLPAKGSGNPLKSAPIPTALIPGHSRALGPAEAGTGRGTEQSLRGRGRRAGRAAAANRLTPHQRWCGHALQPGEGVGKGREASERKIERSVAAENEIGQPTGSRRALNRLTISQQKFDVNFRNEPRKHNE